MARPDLVPQEEEEGVYSSLYSSPGSLSSSVSAVWAKSNFQSSLCFYYVKSCTVLFPSLHLAAGARGNSRVGGRVSVDRSRVLSRLVHPELMKPNDCTATRCIRVLVSLPGQLDMVLRESRNLASMRAVRFYPPVDKI